MANAADIQGQLAAEVENQQKVRQELTVAKDKTTEARDGIASAMNLLAEAVAHAGTAQRLAGESATVLHGLHEEAEQLTEVMAQIGMDTSGAEALQQAVETLAQQAYSQTSEVERTGGTISEARQGAETASELAETAADDIENRSVESEAQERDIESGVEIAAALQQ